MKSSVSMALLQHRRQQPLDVVVEERAVARRHVVNPAARLRRQLLVAHAAAQQRARHSRIRVRVARGRRHGADGTTEAEVRTQRPEAGTHALVRVTDAAWGVQLKGVQVVRPQVAAQLFASSRRRVGCGRPRGGVVVRRVVVVGRQARQASLQRLIRQRIRVKRAGRVASPVLALQHQRGGGGRCDARREAPRISVRHARHRQRIRFHALQGGEVRHRGHRRAHHRAVGSQRPTARLPHRPTRRHRVRAERRVREHRVHRESDAEAALVAELGEAAVAPERQPRAKVGGRRAAARGEEGPQHEQHLVRVVRPIAGQPRRTVGVDPHVSVLVRAVCQRRAVRALRLCRRHELAGQPHGVADALAVQHPAHAVRKGVARCDVGEAWSRERERRRRRRERRCKPTARIGGNIGRAAFDRGVDSVIACVVACVTVRGWRRLRDANGVGPGASDSDLAFAARQQPPQTRRQRPTCRDGRGVPTHRHHADVKQHRLGRGVAAAARIAAAAIKIVARSCRSGFRADEDEPPAACAHAADSGSNAEVRVWTVECVARARDARSPRVLEWIEGRFCVGGEALGRRHRVGGDVRSRIRRVRHDSSRTDSDVAEEGTIRQLAYTKCLLRHHLLRRGTPRPARAGHAAVGVESTRRSRGRRHRWLRATASTC
mmetsp:Transcript_7165/g.25562  ORF Transcript_7165/g.25562 Transcript_7165/m.25562 type:complete len:660 (+) Transcript_7165:17-1996(+)